MSTLDSLTEDIAQIQDNLAEIVTRDLIAGKVTSPRDATRIVAIGRVIAELSDVARAVTEVQELVEDLAVANPIVEVMGYFCAVCRDAPPRWEDMSLLDHSPACPWRRAVEWVDAQELVAGKALEDPMQASMVRAVVESEAGEAVDLEELDSGDSAGETGRAVLEALIRARVLTDTGKRYTLEEVCVLLGISYEKLVAEEE